MNILKVAAFSDEGKGGNPAGVALVECMPSESEMQKAAHKLGFSETVFAQRLGDDTRWRVRYFAPESEVAFCGHATIALGAVLAENYGNGHYSLSLNNAEISVEAGADSNHLFAALQSPNTSHRLLEADEINDALAVFGYQQSQVSNFIPAALIDAGIQHYVFALNSLEDLAQMNYELDVGREFMQSKGIVTIMFVVNVGESTFEVRNAFASGGVLEDPATGAAAAAFLGYLRDTEWLAEGEITILQGRHMNRLSLIKATATAERSSAIKVSGTVHKI